MDAAQLAHEVKESGLDIPVVVLAYDYRKIKDFIARNPVTDIDRIFLWQGNVRILIAIIKYIEDKRNVLHDTEVMGVPVVLVVEDNIRYYSSFLPMIYTELITQSRRVIREGMNVAHKLVRMGARPRILLCSNYEDATQQVTSVRLGVVGIIYESRPNVTADAAALCLKSGNACILRSGSEAIHSAQAITRCMARALSEGSSFLRKRSATFLGDLRRVLIEQFAFGDFVFRLPDRTEVARASDLNAFEERLHEVPAESIAYHGQRNHFSHWLMARTEFALAQKLRPRKVSDFASYEDLRRDLIDSIEQYRHEQSQVLIGDFNPVTFQAAKGSFLRIGGGSLGGKARGLAFLRNLLHKNRMGQCFDGVRIAVPPSVVVATDVRWELTRYRGEWRLRREVDRISSEVNRVNWRFRHGFDSWRLRRQVDSLRAELHQIEVQLHVRGGDYYRWD